MKKMNNTSRNHFVDVNGISKTIGEWCKESGYKSNVVFQRIRYGWCEVCAVSLPKGQKCSHKKESAN